MTSQKIRSIAVGFLVAMSVGACSGSKNPGFQGWIEADMIFVSPDEQVLEMYRQPAGGKEFKMLEIRYLRKK